MPKFKIAKTLSRLTREAENYSRLLIYQTLILSKIDYGAMAYNSIKVIKQKSSTHSS